MMIKQDIYNVPGYAGIYSFTNKITGKTYIGAAIKLQKKLKEHWRDFDDPLKVTKLASEVRQFGIQNFELKILETIHDALSWRTPRQLEERLQKYISEYGYESIQEPLKIRYVGCEETLMSFDGCLKSKDITTGHETVGGTIEDLAIILGISKTTVKNCLTGAQIVGSKKFLITYYDKEYPEIPDVDTWDFDDMLKEQFAKLSTPELIKEYIKENPNCSYGEIKQNYSLTKNQFYEYKNSL